MYRLLRRLAVGSGLMLFGALVAVFFLYRAATAPVPEYQAVLERTQQQLQSGESERSRLELESQLAALYSDANALNRWDTVLTTTQLNGWLATQLDKDFPELEEQGLRDLRVLMKPGVATLAMQAELHGLNTIVAIDLKPFIAEDGSLALELSAARLGSAPLPIQQILNQLNGSLDEEGLPGRWGQNNGHPVLLLDLAEWISSYQHQRSVETIEVRDGEIYVAGVTQERVARVAKLP